MNLVTGGCGFIGRHLVRALYERGEPVRILDPAPAEDFPVTIEAVRGSVLDPAALDAALANVGRVYHLAGIAKLWTKDKSDFIRINAEGTKALLDAAAARGVGRVVHCSTEAILMSRRRSTGASIDETSRPELADMPGPYTRSKLIAEQSVLAAVAGGLDAVIVNPTVPIGPGDQNLTPPAAMLLMFLQGRSPAFLDCTLNLVDVRDVANGFIFAAERGRAGERYILGGENIAMRDLLTLVQQVSGRSMPRHSVPGWLALASASVAEVMADVVTGRAPAATREGVRLALRSGPFESSKARNELGYISRGLRDALVDTVQWLVSTHMLR
jgi:dihydroflavonol-4-reductase